MIAVSLVLSLAIIPWNSSGFVHGDEVEILNDDQATSVESLSQDQRIEIMRDYFETQGLKVYLDEHEYDQYELAVVGKMAEVVRNKKDFMENYRRVCEVNSLIHSSLARHQDANEAVLQSLDLIVPRSFSQVVLEAAKKDLREFHLDSPHLASDLLKWVQEDLDAGVFHTQDAIRFLEGSFHNWVPLGQLNKFIEEDGEVQQSDHRD